MKVLGIIAAIAVCILMIYWKPYNDEDSEFN